MGKLNISIYKVFGGGFWGVVLFFVGVLLIICETGVEHNRIFKHVQQNFKTWVDPFCYYQNLRT